MRQAEVSRKTGETDIRLRLELDGTGKSVIDTGVGFLDHMLTLFARHGRFDLEVSCKGDTYVDDHHSVEDILLVYDLQIPAEKVGTFDTELTEEFFRALAHNACATLHIKQLSGGNSHHIIEGAFKSVARSLRAAVAIDPACADEIPSTKGVL